MCAILWRVTAILFRGEIKNERRQNIDNRFVIGRDISSFRGVGLLGFDIGVARTPLNENTNPDAYH